jgi:hypothetical protein
VLRHDFHEPSRTHIVWCPGIGRSGAKGFGDAADEAFRMFGRHLQEMLDGARLKDLQRWSRNLVDDQAERLREARIHSLAARERLGEYSLGLDPSQIELLTDEPGGIPSNERIVEALEDGLAMFRDASRSRTLDGMRDAIAEHARTLREGRRERCDAPRYRTIRMSAETHARLQLQAHETGIKLQALCRYLLGLHLDRGGVVPDHAEVGTMSQTAHPDPLMNLSSAIFARVAKASRMSRAVLAAIRNGQVADLPFVVAGRIGAALPVPVPANDIVRYAASGARLPPAMAARSTGSPTAIKHLMTLEEVARQAGMSTSQIEKMLAE